MLCPVNERRSGPPRGPVEDNLLLFCYESSSERNRRNSLKWRRARLNNSAFTINFQPPPHLDTSPDHRACRLIMGMLSNSQYNALSGPVATWEAVGAWVFVWVCNLVCLIIKTPQMLFIADQKYVTFFLFKSLNRSFSHWNRPSFYCQVKIWGYVSDMFDPK